MVRGSCLCGDVHFEADEVPLITSCHCSACRKAQGSAFGTFASVPREQLRLQDPRGLVRDYESSPGNRRPFCTACGSRVPALGSDGTWVVPAGLFDDDPGARNTAEDAGLHDDELGHRRHAGPVVSEE